jgi:hypothetical protein
MKKKLAVLTVALLIFGVMVLPSYAQQGKMEKKMDHGQSHMQAGPEMMQQMMKGMRDNPMMLQSRNMMHMLIYPDSPGSIVALKDRLRLSKEQIKKLGAVEEKANAEGKRILNAEQIKELEALTKDWNPQSMMQLMQTMLPQMQKSMGGQMPPCPMMQMMQAK